jgi:hypothetical protein
MTEADWLACGDPEPMLQFLCECQASERKVRLLACACCRRVWDLLPDPHSRLAVEVAERYADSRATLHELGRVLGPATRVADRASWAAVWAANRKISGPIRNVFDAAQWLGRCGAGYAITDWQAELATRTRWQVGLVHEVIGNPFRPRVLEPVCLNWGNGLVRHLAEGIYEEKAFERMGVLGDALEDAGCRDDVILDHCRGGGEHVRGYWVLDLILGRE